MVNNDVQHNVYIYNMISRVNDCILRVNNIDCHDVERSTVLQTLKNANSVVSLLIKRRK